MIWLLKVSGPARFLKIKDIWLKDGSLVPFKTAPLMFKDQQISISKAIRRADEIMSISSWLFLLSGEKKMTNIDWLNKTNMRKRKRRGRGERPGRGYNKLSKKEHEHKVKRFSGQNSIQLKNTLMWRGTWRNFWHFTFTWSKMPCSASLFKLITICLHFKEL